MLSTLTDAVDLRSVWRGHPAMGQSHPMHLLYHGSVVKVVILMGEVESLPTTVVVVIVHSGTI